LRPRRLGSCLLLLERQYAKEHESEMDLPKILAWVTSKWAILTVRLAELYQTQDWQSCFPKLGWNVSSYAKEHKSEMDVPKILALVTLV